MGSSKQKRAFGAWFGIAVLLFLAAVASVIASALTDSSLIDDVDDAPLLVFGIAALASLVGWWWERSRRVSADEDVRRERERLESELREREGALRESREREAAERRDREQRDSALKDSQEALSRERYLRSRSDRAHEAEKDWRQELNTEVLRLSRERGVLGAPDDIPSMVLRLSKTLLEAEKGLLLSGRDENGELELVAAEGFEHDPKDSAIVRRFAEKVLERDQTVRETDPQDVDPVHRGGADEEIENLVAVPIYLQDEFSGVVVCANNPQNFEDYDDEVLLTVGDQAGAVLQNARLQGELRDSYLATVSLLAAAIEVKDPLLRGHSEEVSGYVAAVAERLDIPPGRREELIFGSLLHDVGKIGISERILLKPAALTPEEHDVMKLHPRLGHRLVSQVPALQPIAPAILHHHERFDGSGYPSGLRGEEIPLEARIVCVADSFSAMVSERPYHERMTVEDACVELERNAGTQFDPEIVRVFVEEVRRRPPQQQQEAVLADLESEARRGNDEPILGHDAIAAIDNLTLLYTRRRFHETAQAEARRAEARGRPFGVVLVELAGVPELNWKRGYAVGDEAIRTAARVAQRVAARHGGTAFRYGGHRLGVTVPDTGERAAELIADEILAGLGDDLSALAATAAWRPGDAGDAVIVRARARLDSRSAPRRG